MAKSQKSEGLIFLKAYQKYMDNKINLHLYSDINHDKGCQDGLVVIFMLKKGKIRIK